MADYIYEGSNERHVGVLIMRDGSSPYPLGDFVRRLNASQKLLDNDSEFYGYVAKGMQSTEELNNMAQINNIYTLQCSQWALKIKNSGNPVYFTDSEYFRKKFEEVKGLVPNSSEQLAACRNLYKVFSRAMENSVEWNKQTAQKLHLPSLKEDKQK